MRKLLFFHAPWCPPCRFYEKEFISFLEKIVGKEQIQRVDAQADPFTAEKYHVDKLPTVVLLDGETVRMNRTGAIDVNEVANWLRGGDPDDLPLAGNDRDSKGVMLFDCSKRPAGRN